MANIPGLSKKNTLSAKSDICININGTTKLHENQKSPEAHGLDSISSNVLKVGATEISRVLITFYIYWSFT